MINKQHTEEDTFNKLRKPPFGQIYDIVSGVLTSSAPGADVDYDEIYETLHKHGWTFIEYTDELYKTYKSS